MEDLSRVTLRFSNDEDVRELDLLREVVLKVRERAGYKVPVTAVVKALMGLRPLGALRDEDRASLSGHGQEPRAKGFPPYRPKRRG